MTAESTFDAVWPAVAGIPGWLTPEQARALWDCAARVPAGGRVVEIGSFQGRSTSVLAAAVGGAGARVTAVDPFISGLGLHKEDEISRGTFEANLERLGLRDTVDLTVSRSVAARPTWAGTIDFLYIDGKHDVRTVLDDLRWVEDVRSGGEVAVHDAFSSIGVTLALLIGVRPRGPLRYAGRVGSLALFTKVDGGSRRWPAMLGQLGWFARNVVIKVLLRLRLRPVARLLGHRLAVDPY
jgi:predicted O-methyltransferase YrrM